MSLAGYHLYSRSAMFVAVAKVRQLTQRPPTLIEYRDRHYLRHTDGNYYEADVASHVELEQHLEAGQCDD